MNIFFASCNITTSTRQTDRIVNIEAALRGNKVKRYVYNVDEDDVHHFKYVYEDILACDVYIAEMSQPSQTLGFQLAFALSNAKPCLYLYDHLTYGKPSVPLANHPSRLIRIASYSPETLQKEIDKFLRYAQGQLKSTRTSFMSTKAIDGFLTSEAIRRSISKGELIRTILGEAAQKHL